MISQYRLGSPSQPLTSPTPLTDVLARRAGTYSCELPRDTKVLVLVLDAQVLGESLTTVQVLMALPPVAVVVPVWRCR